MKKAIIFLSLLTALSSAGMAQDPAADVKENLLAIDQLCQNIREKGFTRVDTIRFDCPQTPDYGMVRYYIQDNEVRYIEIEGSDQSHSDYLKRFYLKDQLPVMVRIRLESWSFSGNPPDDGSPAPTSEHFYESIFYAKDGKGLLCQERSYSVSSDSISLVNADDYPLETMHCSFFAEFVLPDFHDLMKVYAARKKKHNCLFELLDPR